MSQGGLSLILMFRQSVPEELRNCLSPKSISRWSLVIQLASLPPLAKPSASNSCIRVQMTTLTVMRTSTLSTALTMREVSVPLLIITSTLPLTRVMVVMVMVMAMVMVYLDTLKLTRFTMLQEDTRIQGIPKSVISIEVLF